MSLLEIINTPERRAEAQAQQDRLREQYGHRLAQNPAQSKFSYGLAREQSAIDGLAALETDETFGAAALHARQIELYRQLAEGFAAQARFTEAVEAATEGQDAGHVDEYAAKAVAIGHLGEKACQCPEEITDPSSVDAKGITRKTRTKIEEVFDGERVITIYRCSECKTLSAEVG